MCLKMLHAHTYNDFFCLIEENCSQNVARMAVFREIGNYLCRQFSQKKIDDCLPVTSFQKKLKRLGRVSSTPFGFPFCLLTLPTADILSGKNARALVSMVSYLKQNKKLKY